MVPESRYCISGNGIISAIRKITSPEMGANIQPLVNVCLNVANMSITNPLPSPPLRLDTSPRDVGLLTARQGWLAKSYPHCQFELPMYQSLWTSLGLLSLAPLISGLQSKNTLVESVVDFFQRAEKINQVQQFSHHQSFVQRVLAISSSTTSIVFCLTAMYMFLAIDPRRLVFRHQLIFFLLFFDLLKAVVLLMYPSRVLTNYLAYYNVRFCRVVGFFTALAIEGADFAILTFAIHTFLLIFKPLLNVRVGNSRRVEGGLYTFRYYIYATSLLIPIVLASLAFIHSSGYESFVCWCYLPQKPVWYRMVLSWVPRWVIILTILFCYVGVYFHVIRQIRHLSGVFTTLKKKRTRDDNERPSFFSSLKYFMNSLQDQLFPQLLIPEHEYRHQEKPHITYSEPVNTVVNSPAPDTSASQNIADTLFDFNDNVDQYSSSEDEIDEGLNGTTINDYNGADDNPPPLSPNNLAPPHQISSPSNFNLDKHGTDIHLENLKHFRKRQRIIKKQMKSIFIYPLAYIFVWLFPFILYCTQINYEEKHGPIYWLNCLGAFMQPFNGFVDSLVFFYRETPWKYTVMNKFKKDHGERMDTLLNKHYSQSYGRPSVRSYSQNGRSSRSQSLYESVTSNYTNSGINSSIGYPHNSLSADLNVDLTRFKSWRWFLNNLKLPLFALPTDTNLNKLQQQYISNKLNNQQPPEPIDLRTKNPPVYHASDFSNILEGSLGEDKSFRPNLDNFAFNFNHRSSISNQPRTKSASSIPPVTSTTLTSHVSSSGRKISSPRSYKSRQHSVDPNEPVIIEGQFFASGMPVSPGSNRRYSVSTNNRRKSSYTSGNVLSGGRKENSGSPNPPKKLSKASLESMSADSDDEMDFLEFLKKGPP